MLPQHNEGDALLCSQISNKLMLLTEQAEVMRPALVAAAAV